MVTVSKSRHSCVLTLALVAACTGNATQADRGEAGSPGATGAEGPQGPQGLQGLPGTSSSSAISVNVKDYGASGDGLSNDTAAFVAALAAGVRVEVPSGTYLVEEVTVPSDRSLVGTGMWGTTLLKPAVPCAYLVRLMSGATIQNLRLDGAEIATRGVSIGGDYVHAYTTTVEHCTYGFYNEGFDVWRLVGNRTASNTFGFYSADRGINIVIDQHEASDTYGLYFTRIDQQPQAVRITNSLFFGCDTAVYFATDFLYVTILDSVIDSNVGTAIATTTTEPATSAYLVVQNNFLSGTLPVNSQAAIIELFAQIDDVIIDGNTLGNAGYGIVVRATTDSRSTHVQVSKNSFRNLDHAVHLDSPLGANLSQNYFAPATVAPNVLWLSSYVGAGPRAPVILRDNVFSVASPVQGTNFDSFENVGWKTKGRGVAVVPAGDTSVIVPHGLSLPPAHVMLTPQFAAGAVWVSGIDATSFVANFSSAPTGNSVVSWTAMAD